MTAHSAAEPSPHYQTRLVEAGARQCRFIVTDSDGHAICCGAPTPEASSWCSWHRRLVFIPRHGERRSA